MGNMFKSHMLKFILMFALLAGNSSFLLSQTKPAIALTIGKFNVLHSYDNTFEMRLEYRKYSSKSVVNPFGGMMFNTQGAFDLYVGIMKDFHLFGKLFFSPSFSPSIYIRGQSKDLSLALEFRSQIELSYQFSSGLRIGVNFNHISNGGLRLPNIGVESLGISYTLPARLITDYFIK